MSVAIDINPEFDVTTEAGSLKTLYNLDTGTEDLNRTICVKELNTRGFTGVNVEGFNEYVHFSSLSDLDLFVDEVKREGFDFDIKKYRNALKSEGDSLEASHIEVSDYKQKSSSENDYTVVFGRIFVNLDNGDILQLCSPVYRVHPNKKGEYLDVDIVENYITEEWTELVKQAFFGSGNTTNSTSDKKGASSSIPTPTLLMGLVLIVACIAVAFPMVFKKSENEVARNVTNNTIPQHKTITPTGGSNQTVEDYAKLQVKQTENMLKELGVDVSTQNNNLGCFTSGG